MTHLPQMEVLLNQLNLPITQIPENLLQEVTVSNPSLALCQYTPILLILMFSTTSDIGPLRHLILLINRIKENGIKLSKAAGNPLLDNATL